MKTGESLENVPKDRFNLFDIPKEEQYLLFYEEN